MANKDTPTATLRQIRSDATIPQEVDVVVIGGGIAGVSTALFLVEKGLTVCICEKGQIGAEQSSRNWGWTRQMGRDPSEMPLSIESMKIWRTLDTRFGIDVGYRETGIIYLCRSAREIKEAEGWAETGKMFQLPQRILDAGQIGDVLPGIEPGFKFALHTTSDGRAEPTMAAPSIAMGARTLGASILTQCAVRGIETSGGRISAAVTEKGPIRCSSVVVAGGAWSRLFLGNLDIEFPQLKILVSAARVDHVSGVPEMPAGGGDFAFRKRLDGGFTIALRNTNIAPIVPDSFRLLPEFLPTFVKSWRELKLRIGRQFVNEFAMPRRWTLDATTPFEQVRILDPAPHEPFNRKAVKNLQRVFPAFSSARITDDWAGLIDATPDGVPVIDQVEELPGLYVSSGFSGHGFGIGPGAGMLMAQLISGETPVVDPAPFRLSRFRSNARKDDVNYQPVAGKA